MNTASDPSYRPADAMERSLTHGPELSQGKTYRQGFLSLRLGQPRRDKTRRHKNPSWPGEGSWGRTMQPLGMPGPTQDPACSRSTAPTLGWPKAEMDTEKVNTNTSAVDPPMALKATEVQVQLWGWEMPELLLAEQRSCPKDCPLPVPRLTPATAGPTSAAWISNPASVAALTSIHQHILCRSPARPWLQPCSSTETKHLMLWNNIQGTAMVNNYQLKRVHKVEFGQ